jgi:hypothetical protein
MGSLGVLLWDIIDEAILRQCATLANLEDFCGYLLLSPSAQGRFADYFRRQREYYLMLS